MRAATIASVAALASTSLAAPWQGWQWGNKNHGGRPGGYQGGRPGKWNGPGSYNDTDGTIPGQGAQCLTKAEGEEAADVFRLLIQEYSDELALEWLTEDFVDWSSSVNGIINGGGDTPKPLDQPTFASRQEFMDGQGSQPEIPFETLGVWVGCDFASMRWTTSDSAAGQETKAAELVSFNSPDPIRYSNANVLKSPSLEMLSSLLSPTPRAASKPSASRRSSASSPTPPGS